MFNRNLLTGRRILVTGGGTGLGKSMSEGFLTLGADLVICGRRRGMCEEAADSWRSQFPDRNIETHGLDIRDAAAVESMVDSIWASGPLDGLVNNAAGNFLAQTQDLSTRGFDAIANIVFHGTFYVTQAVGKRWVADAKEARWVSGHAFRSVVSIITSWVRNGSPFVVPSAMSKAGVDVMTKSLAVEWARFGIRLNCIGPGEIPTEGMSKRLNPGNTSGDATVLTAQNPMGRVGKMSELQNLAAFLIAPGCDWLSGESIVMDGANANATGGNFYDLRRWGDSEWSSARAKAAAQSAKEKP